MKFPVVLVLELDHDHIEEAIRSISDELLSATGKPRLIKTMHVAINETAANILSELEKEDEHEDCDPEDYEDEEEGATMHTCSICGATIIDPE